MPDTVFLLIRHGAASPLDVLGGRTSGVHLTEVGRRQAEALPTRLAELPIAAIYSSPLERTRETAAPLAAARGLTVRVLDEAVELDFGRWTGRALVELEQDPLWREFNRFRSAVPPPEGESIAEVQTRFARGLNALRERHPGELVAVFSHQDVIRAVLCLYLGMPLDFLLRLTIDHASVSMVSVHDSGAEVLHLNVTPQWRFAR